MELEIRPFNSNRLSFLIRNINVVMDNTRVSISALGNLETQGLNCLSESSNIIDDFDLFCTQPDLYVPFEPTGNAIIVLDFAKANLIVHPDCHSYIHFPLYRHIPNWQEHID